jgi:hypothetical protein
LHERNARLLATACVRPHGLTNFRLIPTINSGNAYINHSSETFNGCRKSVSKSDQAVGAPLHTIIHGIKVSMLIFGKDDAGNLVKQYVT